MSKLAVITDIHGNLPALEASSGAIETIGVSKVYCGGDLVGYGPHPDEVCSLIKERGSQDVHLVHGSPRKVNEYLFEDKPASLYERLAAAEAGQVMVFGHTHKPGEYAEKVVLAA